MLQMKKSRLAGRLLRVFIVIFILMNVIAAFHAYRFTHFDNKNLPSQSELELSTA